MDNVFVVKMYRVEVAINVPMDFGILSLEMDAKVALAILMVALISAVMHTQATVIASLVLVVKHATHVWMDFMDFLRTDANVSYSSD